MRIGCFGVNIRRERREKERIGSEEAECAMVEWVMGEHSRKKDLHDRRGKTLGK